MRNCSAGVGRRTALAYQRRRGSTAPSEWAPLRRTGRRTVGEVPRYFCPLFVRRTEPWTLGGSGASWHYLLYQLTTSKIGRARD